jgi:hypothetical protein
LSCSNLCTWNTIFSTCCLWSPNETWNRTYIVEMWLW